MQFDKTLDEDKEKHADYMERLGKRQDAADDMYFALNNLYNIMRNQKAYPVGSYEWITGIEQAAKALAIADGDIK